MQRYFVKLSIDLGACFSLDKEDNHHLVRVMRARQGEELIVVDDNEQAFKVRVSEINEGTAKLEVVQRLKEPSKKLPVSVTIACGISKNEKIDFIVQKGTELGMDAFVPVSLKRDVAKWKAEKANARNIRLTKIAKEAAEQAHRDNIPTIQQILTLPELIQLGSRYEYKLIAYEETAKAGEVGQLKQVLQSVQQGSQLLMVFGSEGGFDPEEVKLLETAGFVSCSLGPRILRAETAPLYALSAISYALEN